MPDARDLTFEEWGEVIALIRRAVEQDRFSVSDHIRRLRSALEKLDPVPPLREPRRPPSPKSPTRNRGV